MGHRPFPSLDREGAPGAVPPPDAVSLAASPIAPDLASPASHVLSFPAPSAAYVSLPVFLAPLTPAHPAAFSVFAPFVGAPGVRI